MDRLDRLNNVESADNTDSAKLHFLNSMFNEKGSSLVGILISTVILLLISVTTYSLFGGASQMLITASQSNAALTASMLAAHDATLPAGYASTAVTGSVIIQPSTGSTISTSTAEQVQLTATASTSGSSTSNASAGLPWFTAPPLVAATASPS
ncbi:hypothetical protein HAP94_12185 [Acidithiobacillus ferrivorans]|nr:hypothetical protein [Acidithiobacillus ferrivorans]